MKQIQKAFTLFEILIAVFIFAILGLLAGLTLHSVIKTHGRLQLVDKELMQVQMAEVLLTRDVSQIINRPVVLSNGMTYPALVTYQQSGLAFTTFGHQNPSYVAKVGDLVRVGYVLQGDQLLRYVWPALDETANSSEPTKKMLLKGVQAMQVQYLDAHNRWVDTWPEPNSGVASMAKRSGQALPKSIRIGLRLKRWGRLERIINLPGVTRDVASN